jgi:hypothetical protein
MDDAVAALSAFALFALERSDLEGNNKSTPTLLFKDQTFLFKDKNTDEARLKAGTSTTFGFQQSHDLLPTLKKGASARRTFRAERNRSAGDLLFASPTVDSAGLAGKSKSPLAPLFQKGER